MENGLTPLHAACQIEYFDMVKVLIESGANVNAKDNEKHTPIHRSCLGGEFKIVEFLIESGAEINIAESENG